MDRKAHLAGIGFAIIFGFSFLLSKLALKELSPMGLLAYRFLFAYLTFYFLKSLHIIQFKFNKHMFLTILPVIIFQPVLYFLFETYGLRFTSSGEAGLMIALIPIFVAILSSFLMKEKPSFIQIFFIIVSVSGVLIIQIYKSFELSSSLWGFILLFGAVLSAAFFNLISRKVNQTYRAAEITYLMMIAGAITFNIIYIIELSMNHHIIGYVTNILSLHSFLPVFTLGALVSTGGFFLVNYTLHHIPAHISSIYTNLSTIVAVIAGIVFLRESISFYHLIGSILIISGVYGTVIFQNKKAAKSATP